MKLNEVCLKKNTFKKAILTFYQRPNGPFQSPDPRKRCLIRLRESIRISSGLSVMFSGFSLYRRRSSSQIRGIISTRLWRGSLLKTSGKSPRRSASASSKNKLYLEVWRHADLSRKLVWLPSLRFYVDYASSVRPRVHSLGHGGEEPAWATPAPQTAAEGPVFPAETPARQETREGLRSFSVWLRLHS